MPEPTKRSRRSSPFDVETLWRIERLGSPSLSPDGAQGVCSVSVGSMDENRMQSSLWLFSTLGGAPRRLTRCGERDGSPQWGPHREGHGERIAFIARRSTPGAQADESPQLYAIAPDGGEAQRLTTVETGVEAFRWFPDGRRIAFLSWVWPGLKGHKAQARRLHEERERKESGVATGETLFRHWDHNLPVGRAVHLHVLDVDSGRFRDLFEGGSLELARTDVDAHGFDISPDGRRIVFAYDPDPVKRPHNPSALAEIELRSGRVRELVRDAEWWIGHPRYSPDGDRIAFTAARLGRKPTMPEQLGVWERESGAWQLESEAWDHAIEAPLLWEEDGQALLLCAQQRGRRHLWRFDLPDRRAEIVVEGGWVQGFDKRAGTLVSLADSRQHPPRLQAHLPGQAPRRLETFNDRLLQPHALGRSEEVVFEGASAERLDTIAAGRGDGDGDPVQMWLTYPPGFDAERVGRRRDATAQRWPVLQVVHGGPHAAAGDTWHFRWNAQLFAAQGYVVAEVNYHGSSGFGYAFLDSITHRWGQLESVDLEAATDWLLQQGWADPQRLFLGGGSYGGFLAAWTNGHVPAGRYAALVCHAGCWDWRAMYAGDAGSWLDKELGASYWIDPGKVDGQSAHGAAAAMRTPTLVIHGALDYRVPDAQGLAYYNTLKSMNVDARLLWFPDENHWVLKPRNSRQWYREFLDWLRRHDPASKPVVRRKRAKA